MFCALFSSAALQPRSSDLNWGSSLADWHKPQQSKQVLKEIPAEKPQSRATTKPEYVQTGGAHVGVLPPSVNPNAKDFVEYRKAVVLNTSSG